MDANIKIITCSTMLLQFFSSGIFLRKQIPPAISPSSIIIIRIDKIWHLAGALLWPDNTEAAINSPSSTINMVTEAHFRALYKAFS